MQNILKILRYLIFSVFIICNAIVASVAVWNHSLAQSAGWDSQIDVYLIFLGCFGLALIFTIIFVELAYRDSITGRVWFECAWIGLFSLLYLVGAAVVSAIAPSRLCQRQTIMPGDQCTSTRVMIAFAWISTIMLLLYCSLLVASSLIHLKHDPRIWNRCVYKYSWSIRRHSLPSPPASPLPRFLKKMPSIVAPRPQRAAPPSIYNYRSGLSPDYEIEHYRPPSTFGEPPVPPAIGPPFHHTPSATENFQSSFYPQYMQSILIPEPAYVQPHVHPPPLSPPPPLGDWPRPNAVMQPLRSKRKSRSKPSPAPGASSDNPATVSPRRSRPSGPRRKSEANGTPTVHPVDNMGSGS